MTDFQNGDRVEVRFKGTYESGNTKGFWLRDERGLRWYVPIDNAKLIDRALPKQGVYRDRVGDLWMFRDGEPEVLTVNGPRESRPATQYDREYYAKQAGRWAPFTEVK